jgi:glutathione S-transferase
MYKLYVIPGSHACRSAMLMLEHKRIPYRVVNFVTLLHPLMSRLHGFDAGGETRSAGGRQTLGLRMGDRLGTVPALDADGERVSTNHGIARFLDERHPDPPLLPREPEQRAAVEEAEAWANGPLQMAARRVPAVAAVRDPDWFAQAAGDGRLGYLLYRSERLRRLIVPRVLGRIFVAGPNRAEEIEDELRGMLDKIDALVADGVLNGEELNVADFMVAPSLALMLYREDIQPLFEGRPALELVDRLLPDPAGIQVPSRSR